MQNKHIAIIGPTGIGKSQYSYKLQDRFKSEIISVDAYQIYKGFDIGTAKVSQHLLKSIPHHFINEKQAEEHYSAAEFCEACESLLHNTKSHYILVGGTAFYMYAFLHKYAFSQEAKTNQELRAHLNQRYESEGFETLMEELKSLSYQTALNVPKNNKHRLVRSLETVLLTGKAPSLEKTSLVRSDIHLIGLTTSRNTLYNNINKRVIDMINQGFIEEVNTLKRLYPINAPAFKAIGYLDIVDYLSGRISKEDMILSIQKKTRNLAKRQLTWLRKFKNVEWITLDD